MPLQVRHTRNGAPIAYEWGGAQLLAILDVAKAQGIRDTLRLTGYAVIQEAATFPDAGMEFRPGDVIEMWR